MGWEGRGWGGVRRKVEGHARLEWRSSEDECVAGKMRQLTTVCALRLHRSVRRGEGRSGEGLGWVVGGDERVRV